MHGEHSLRNSKDEDEVEPSVLLEDREPHKSVIVPFKPGGQTKSFLKSLSIFQRHLQ